MDEDAVSDKVARDVRLTAGTPEAAGDTLGEKDSTLVGVVVFEARGDPESDALSAEDADADTDASRALRDTGALGDTPLVADRALLAVGAMPEAVLDNVAAAGDLEGDIALERLAGMPLGLTVALAVVHAVGDGTATLPDADADVTIEADGDGDALTATFVPVGDAETQRVGRGDAEGDLLDVDVALAAVEALGQTLALLLAE